MLPTVTSQESIQSLLLTCAFKGTLLLALVGVIAVFTTSASRRHFTWVCGFLALGILLALEPILPKWGVLPNLQAGSWWSLLKPWVLPVWLLGSVLFCGKVALGLITLLRIERVSSDLASEQPWKAILEECRRDLGIRRPVHLLRFPGRIMPMTWGVFRHFVVLPSSAMRWSGQRLRAVLMHELAHIRRRDYLASLLRDAVCALYWFHPLVWWAAREMDDDREEASDDAVIAAGQRPVAYAEHLATVATRGRSRRAYHPQVRPKIALAEKPLLVRVRAILRPWKSRHPLTWSQRFQTVGALVILLAALVLIGPRPSSEISIAGVTSDATATSPQLFHPVTIPERLDPSVDAVPMPTAPLKEAVHGWDTTALPLDASIAGGALHVSDHVTRSGSEALPGMDLASLAVAAPSGHLVETSSYLLEGSSQELAQSARHHGHYYLPPTEYSTSPPEDADSSSEAIDISELMDSFENVGHVGMADFDLGHLAEGNHDDSGGAFDLGDLSGDLFGIASVTTAKEPLVLRESPSALPTPKQQSARQTRPGTEKATSPSLPVAGQRKDPGLLTQVGLVTSRITGKRHLAITFRRVSGAPTAKFRFEASPDLHQWDFDADLFLFAGARTINGESALTIVLNEAIPETPYRFLRIRSTSSVDSSIAD